MSTTFYTSQNLNQNRNKLKLIRQSVVVLGVPYITRRCGHANFISQVRRTCRSKSQWRIGHHRDYEDSRQPSTCWHPGATACRSAPRGSLEQNGNRARNSTGNTHRRVRRDASAKRCANSESRTTRIASGLRKAPNPHFSHFPATRRPSLCLAASDRTI